MNNQVILNFKGDRIPAILIARQQGQVHFKLSWEVFSYLQTKHAIRRNPLISTWTYITDKGSYLSGSGVSPKLILVSGDGQFFSVKSDEWANANAPFANANALSESEISISEPTRDNPAWKASGKDSDGVYLHGQGSTEKQARQHIKERIEDRNAFLALSDRDQLARLVSQDYLPSNDQTAAIKLIARILGV